MKTPIVLANGFGGRLRALITPAQSGDFVFSVSSAGAAELLLSSDGQIANLSPQADVLSAQTDIPAGIWDRYPNQQSAAVALTAGTPYLLELRYIASAPSSHCQAAWSGPGISGTEVIFSSPPPPPPSSTRDPFQSTAVPRLRPPRPDGRPVGRQHRHGHHLPGFRFQPHLDP